MPRELGRLGVAALLATLWSVSGVSFSEEREGYAGDEQCAFCHEEVAEAFAMSPHATARGWDPEYGCEDCHGPLAEHAEGDPEAVVPFSELSKLESTQRCLTCHQHQERQFNGRRSLHTLNDVACVDCHTAHSHETNLLERLSVERCGACHQPILADMALARYHPLPETGKRRGQTTGLPKSIDCEACHPPHTQNTLHVNTGFSPVATCRECHTEKYGPFIYAHDVGMVDGCGACHMAHGSTNRHLLRDERQINLCYRCHPGTSTPGFHNAQAYQTEKCVACHTAIHGSNSQQYFLEE